MSVTQIATPSLLARVAQKPLEAARIRTRVTTLCEMEIGGALFHACARNIPRRNSLRRGLLVALPCGLAQRAISKPPSLLGFRALVRVSVGVK